MDELNREIIQNLLNIGRVAVIGGVVRDLAIFGASERPISDIDFVVSGSPLKLSNFAMRIGAKENRFGGFGLQRGGYKVDFWSLSRTWARTNKYALVNKLPDLTKTTFFDWDSVVYEMNTKKIHAIDQYITRINRRILDINLLPNPSVNGNLVRALRRLVMWDARPGRRLSAFLVENMYGIDWKTIVELEENAFHTTFLRQFDSASDFRAKALYRSTSYTTGLDERRQMNFNF